MEKTQIGKHCLNKQRSHWLHFPWIKSDTTPDYWISSIYFPIYSRCSHTFFSLVGILISPFDRLEWARVCARSCGSEMQPFSALLPLTVYCISLLSLQLLALRTEDRPDSDRLNLINHLFDSTEDPSPVPPKPSPSPSWLSSLLRHPPAAGVRRTLSSPRLSWARPADPSPDRILLRSRRHLHGFRNGHHHQPHHYPSNAQLMRVGCVLGTCQVQNLSHRLYQLIGQSGREDSSPINPKSPHSYGWALPLAFNSKSFYVWLFTLSCVMARLCPDLSKKTDENLPTLAFLSIVVFHN